MTDPTPGAEILHLAADFPPAPTAAWEAAIQKDLKGADYEKKLVWRTDEGLAVRPYYRREDAAGVTAPVGIPAGWAIVQDGALPDNAVRADEWHDQGATAVQELAYALSAAVEQLANGSKPAFVFAIGSNYFFEIAKLRAARLLWQQVAQAFGATEPVAIYARTARSNKSLFDPYTNLLRVTTEALSAAIGGCDALTVEAYGFDSHLAANVHHIVKEEAHIDKVADPAAGSYYVESLTHSLAQEAWKLFQQVEAQGGFTAAKPAIEAAIAASRTAKEKAVASRRRTLVGVNNYPNTMEKTPASGIIPARWRLAQPFENIRNRTLRYAKANGRYPKVLLLKRGDVKMRMARAQFCLNFFGCAGFDIVESDTLEHADLIVLCSSDPEYLGLALDVIPQTEAPVLVAGNPKDQIDALKGAGVAGFVHLLSNAVDTLTEWQDKLGLPKLDQEPIR
ncbi:MAG: methylmalonyl-CoA mutase family protein [Bryobacteraceae bacterium]|nr:methylmalonyl-CoA mutase family protein [Bryobacteraceae bacterium]